MSAPVAAPLVVVGDTLLDVEVEGRVERICPAADRDALVLPGDVVAGLDQAVVEVAP